MACYIRNNFPSFPMYPSQPHFAAADSLSFERKRKRLADEDDEMREDTWKLFEHIPKQSLTEAGYCARSEENDLDINEGFNRIFYDPSSFDIQFNIDEVSEIDQYFELAKSLCDRFLINCLQMNTQQYAPGLHYTALLIAMKFLGNQSLQNRNFLNMFPQPLLTIERLNKMEIAFLNKIGWSI